MSDAADTAELRTLQAKAYGRDGALSDAEATRLGELQGSLLPAAEPALDRRDPETPPLGSSGPDAATSSEEPSAPAPAEPLASVQPVEPAAPVVEAVSVEPVSDREGRFPRLLGMIRRHGVSIAASALLFAVGLVVGASTAGSGDAEVALTDAQQERRLELQSSGGYDAGSVRAVGRDEGAIVWYATKDEGELGCVVLDVEDRSTAQCRPAEEIADGQGPGLALRIGEGDETEEIYASTVRAVTGEIVAVLQRWDNPGDSWLTQFSDEEQVRARELVEEGFEQHTFWVVGYFRDESVWYANRYTPDGPEECLIVDAIGETRCLPAGEAAAREDGLVITGETVDVSGSSSTPWSVGLAFTMNGQSYLTVSGDVGGDIRTIAPAETIELGGEHGDPIPVTVPGSGPDY